MKKLMLTSALAGLLVSGSAIAQTTISGELRLNLKATEASVSTAGATNTASKRGFGNEQQINFATKGKHRRSSTLYSCNTLKRSLAGKLINLKAHSDQMHYLHATAGDSYV